MTTEELQQFGIADARDVTRDSSHVAPAPAVNSARAVTIAANHIGFHPTNARILHGVVRSPSTQADRSVWVVLFGGGELPVLGPASRPSQPIVERTYTGVIVDDNTGVVLSWFMR